MWGWYLRYTFLHHYRSIVLGGRRMIVPMALCLPLFACASVGLRLVALTTIRCAALPSPSCRGFSPQTSHLAQRFKCKQGIFCLFAAILGAALALKQPLIYTGHLESSSILHLTSDVINSITSAVQARIPSQAPRRYRAS